MVDKKISLIRDLIKNMPDSIELVARYNKNKLNYCIDHFDDIASLLELDLLHIKTIQEPLYKIKNNTSDRIKYINKPESGPPNSRWVPDSPCFINVKSAIRTFCCNDDSIDIDAKQSHYNIFCWFAKLVNVNVDNYKELCVLLKNKTDTYSVLNGGDCRGYDEIGDSIGEVVEHILKYFPEYGRFLPKEYNRNGQIMSRFLNRIEMVLVYTAYEILRKNNYEVNAMFYDGFFVTRTGESMQQYQNVLDEIESHIYQLLGIKYCFVIKEHEDIIQDKCLPVLTQIEPIIKQDRYVQVQDLEYPKRLILISAGLGLGKSTAISHYISNHRHVYDSIIIICPRQTYSKSVCGELKSILPDLLHYSTTKSRKICKPNLIIQFESLCRVDYEKYKDRKILLIMDECEGTLTQLTSFETNKTNHFKNIQIFKFFIDICKKGIMADAFVHSSQKMLKTLINLNNATITNAYKIDYDFKYFKYDYKYMQRPYFEVDDVDAFEECFTELIKQKKKLFIFSTSKYQIEDKWMNKKIFKGVKVGIYVKDNKASTLEDVNSEWTQYDVVICNSCITIGIDFNLEHFDYICIYATQKSKNLVRDILQASYRPRKVKCGLLLCINQNDSFNVKNTTYRVDIDFQKQKVLNSYQAYSNYIRTNNLNEMHGRTYNWVLNLFIQNAHEHIQDVYNIRERMLEGLHEIGYFPCDEKDPNFFLPKTSSKEINRWRY